MFTQLIVALCDRGEYERAWKIFDHMRIEHCEPDEVTFTTMIAGVYRREGVGFLCPLQAWQETVPRACLALALPRFSGLAPPADC